MKTIACVLAAGSFCLCWTIARADSIPERMNHQDRRIEKGEKSGSLTPKEAERLQNQQDTIHDERARALEDGKMSAGERREIRHDQKQANKSIRRQKHDAQHD